MRVAGMMGTSLVAAAGPAQAWGSTTWNDCFTAYAGTAATYTSSGTPMMYSSTFRNGGGCSNYVATSGPGINGVCGTRYASTQDFIRVDKTRTASHNGACHWSRSNGAAVWT
jgi:hypothetical protein